MSTNKNNSKDKKFKILNYENLNKIKTQISKVKIFYF